jgi:hypothetical protein
MRISKRRLSDWRYLELDVHLRATVDTLRANRERRVVPVRGYAGGGDVANIEFVGIAA